MIIDLTTPQAAMDYLRSLPADQKISLPGHGEAPTTEGAAVRAITGGSPDDWANAQGCWEWTAGELAYVLAAQEQAAGEIVEKILAERKTKMTSEQAIKELEAQQANTDTEEAHLKADEILCKLLEGLGYSEVVEAYDKVGKWYA